MFSLGKLRGTLQQSDYTDEDFESLLKPLPDQESPIISTLSFGKPHGTLQQFDCSVQDFESLLTLLPDQENPFTNWQSKKHIVSTSDITTWFPKDNKHPVFHLPPPSSLLPLMYADLHKCIASCPTYIGSTVTVAVLLPATMMAEMGVVLLSLLSLDNVCVAPLDPKMSKIKVAEALKQLRCCSIVTTKDFLKLDLINKANFRDIRVVEPTGEKVGAIHWDVIHQSQETDAPRLDNMKSPRPHLDEERPVLLLRTSGTTAVPKVVPLTASSLLHNATCIAASLKLQREDVGCNAMPLFHIGGVTCSLLSALVSGSSVLMMGPFDPDAFLDCLRTEANASLDHTRNDFNTATPTWYYGAPSIHKTLILTAKARIQEEGAQDYIPNNIRAIRNAAAHLPHETALELSQVFHTQVIPTYGMSEATPIASSHETPVVWNSSDDDDRKGKAIPNSVGNPCGCSVKIVDELGDVLPYGYSGEVAVLGPGVIQGYDGISRTETHTHDGWLRTGDFGELDINGNLKLCGRLKEMIKRGGEQVWPNEVDRVVEMVPGVSTAVTFGVSNDLWGEEVAVAVVPNESYQASDRDPAVLKRLILEKCREQMDYAAVPSQVIFVPTTDSLLKGPTGKYLRTRLASHLQVEPVDTGALRVLEARAQQGDDTGNEDENKDRSPRKQGAVPSTALNGVRFVTACVVVQLHVGLYPNNAWTKIREFSFDMIIFFILGGFQLACSVKNPVWSHWAEWVGTKIGTMHALFVVSQLFALPSYLLFMCGTNGANGFVEAFEGQTCQDSNFLMSFFPQYLIHTATSMPNPSNFLPKNMEGMADGKVNSPSWFQTAFYVFLILFPLLDARMRNRTSLGLAWRLALCLYMATFFRSLNKLEFRYNVVGWLPVLNSAMIAGYFFSRHAVIDVTPSQEGRRTTTFFQNPRFQGILTDIISIVFLAAVVKTALYHDCIYVRGEEFTEMRPGEDFPAKHRNKWIIQGHRKYTFYEACDVTHEEFVEYVHSDPYNRLNYGRWVTPMVNKLSKARLATPLVLLWLYTMAHGHGLTAKLFNWKIFQLLSPLSYPMYLLHVPISRYYWIATRGLKNPEAWWDLAPVVPFPVEWYETPIIIGACLIVGWILNRYVVSSLSRYTIWLGVKICRAVSRCSSWFFYCCCTQQRNRTDASSPSPSSNATNTGTNLEQVQNMVQRITGMGLDQVKCSTDLSDLGLDSLGATALMGTLRASIPAARKLTLAELVGFETVGDLVDGLDALDEEEMAKDGGFQEKVENEIL